MQQAFAASGVLLKRTLQSKPSGLSHVYPRVTCLSDHFSVVGEVWGTQGQLGERGWGGTLSAGLQQKRATRTKCASG